MVELFAVVVIDGLVGVDEICFYLIVLFTYFFALRWALGKYVWLVLCFDLLHDCCCLLS